MRYVIKRETTGKVGRREYDHQVSILHHFPSFNQALEILKTRKDTFQSPIFKAKIIDPDSDFYVILQSRDLDCIIRYWIEKEERTEPELPWWLL